MISFVILNPTYRLFVYLSNVYVNQPPKILGSILNAIYINKESSISISMSWHAYFWWTEAAKKSQATRSKSAL